MNILIINYEYPPLGGGAANASYFLARELKSLGHQVSVMTSKFEKEGYSLEDNIRVYRINSKRKNQSSSNIKEMLSFVRQGFLNIGKIIKEQKIDNAIIFFSIPCGILGPYIKRKYGVEYIVSLRGGDIPGLEPGLNFIHSILKPVRRKILKQSLSIVSNSNGAAVASKKHDPYDVEVIPNGVDTEYFKPCEERKNKTAFQFLFVGRFQTQKNLFFLLEQIQELKKNENKKFVLSMVGEGPQKNNLIKYASLHNISDCVKFHGWMGKEELVKMYQKCDCLVNPSIYEGMPNVVLEAMACGLPVIASDIMGNNELVINGYNGFLFSLDKADSFQNALNNIFEKEDLRKQMGLNAREHVQKNYSWKSVALKYESLLLNSK